MKSIFRVFFLFFLFSCSTVVSDKEKRGLLLYLDGMPGAGKSSLAKELMRSRSFILISSDGYAEREKISYFHAAKKSFQEAMTLASQGKHVIFDSFLIEEYFHYPLKSSLLSSFDIKLIGVWCQLSCLKSRFDKRAGREGAFLKSNLLQDYEERYGKRPAEDIRHTQGQFQLNGIHDVHYDFFFDSEFIRTEFYAQDLLKHLFKKA